jgi:hypothetical protein
MFKRLLFLGITAGVLAGIASIIYQKVYTSSLGADFSKIATPAGIIASSVIGCVLASVGFWLLGRWMKNRAELVFNLVFVVLSFATIIGPFAVKLPFSVEAPELFPGLTIPMHFFPVLAWLTLKPAFITA